VRIEVILQHGWALDCLSWQSWLPWLIEHGIDFKLGERGYFGLPAASPEFSASADCRIVVAHSLGLHLLDESTLARADAVMAINSFLQFYPRDPKEEKRSKRVIKTMRDKFSQSPDMVLRQFWENCFFPESSHLPITWWAGDSGTSAANAPLPFINLQQLSVDLQLLDEHFLSPALLKGKTVVNVLSARDKIVAPDAASYIGEALTEALTFCLDGCGHASPMLQADTCLLLFSNLVSHTRKSLANVSSTNR
jgi:hypothetical protein